MLSSYRNVIATTQSRYPGVEIEVRYGTFTLGKFHPNITLATFVRLQNELGLITEAVVTETRVDIMGDIRKVTYLASSGASSDLQGRSEWTEKKRVMTRDILPYGMRISACTEREIEAPPTFEPSLTREKKRYSYLIANGAARVDLTHTKTSTGITCNEVEVELLIPEAFDVFSKASEYVLRMVQDTHTLYTEEEKKAVTTYLRNLLPPGELREASPRSLKIRDMVWGGLAGNRETGYTVANNPVGDRRYLVFAPSGIWFISPSGESLSRITNQPFPTLTGTILDGKLIPKTERKSQAPEKKYWYLVFDTLVYQGDRGAQRQSHHGRMQLAQSVSNVIQSPLLELTTMSFYSFNTPPKFFEVMRGMFSRQGTLSYSHDGFTFRPETPTTSRSNVRERVLTTNPEECTWKPVSSLTLELLVRREGENIVLLVNKKEGEREHLVPFTGSRINSFSGVIGVPTLLEDMEGEAIVEFKISPEGDLLPVRILLDREHPIKEEEASELWDEAHHPITEELLQGKTLDLFSYYQSRIRKGLLSLEERRSSDIKLLELGGGKGGDISRWRRYSRIVVLEENPENIPELRRRIGTAKLEQRVLVVEKREEVVEAVESFLGKADIISLGKNVGLFWESEEDLISLVNILEECLAPKGEIVFLILDGDAIDAMFTPAFSPNLRIDKLALGEVTLVPTEEGKLVFNYREDSSSLDKIETPVYIWNLLTFLPEEFRIQEIHHCDTEEFLTQEGKILGRLYSFGRIARGVEARSLHVMAPQRGGRQPSSGRPYTVSRVQGRPETVTLPNPVSAPLVGTVPRRGASRYTPKPRTAPRRELLTNLYVGTPRNRANPGMGEDRALRVNVTWTQEEVYRIACIGDGSCFFHAYLKGFYPEYQDNSSYAYRTELTRNLRDDLAALLSEQDLDDLEGKTFYETISGGALASLGEQQKIIGTPIVDDYGEELDYTLEGMANLLMSNRDVGDELYSYVAEVIGISVQVFRGTNTDIYPQIKAGNPDLPMIGIIGTGDHYELIAVDRGGLFQTVFYPDDPFIQAIRDNLPRE